MDSLDHRDIRDHYTPDTVLKQDYYRTANAINRQSSNVNYYADGYATYYVPDTLDDLIDKVFKKMIDRCIAQGYYDCYNTVVPLVNPHLRESFERMIRKLT